MDESDAFETPDQVTARNRAWIEFETRMRATADEAMAGAQLLHAERNERSRPSIIHSGGIEVTMDPHRESNEGFKSGR